MISSEILGKKDMWYSAPFRGKGQKGQKRCEQSQVKKLVRGQCGTWPQILHFQVHVSFHTHGLHYISPVHNSSNTSQLWSRSRGKVKYIAPGEFIWSMLLLWCHFPEGSYIHATGVCVCVHTHTCICYKIIIISLTNQWQLKWSHWVISVLLWTLLSPLIWDLVSFSQLFGNWKKGQINWQSRLIYTEIWKVKFYASVLMHVGILESSVIRFLDLQKTILNI